MAKMKSENILIWDRLYIRLFLILGQGETWEGRLHLARIHNLANHVDLQTVTSEKAFLVFLAAIKS